MYLNINKFITLSNYVMIKLKKIPFVHMDSIKILLLFVDKTPVLAHGVDEEGG